MKAYIVTWDVKQFNRKTGYIAEVEAEDKNRARDYAKIAWTGAHRVGNIPHMFHLKVMLCKPGEEILSTRRWFKVDRPKNVTSA